MQTVKSKINFQELLVNLLSKLSDREQAILKQRYQLTSDLERKSTLKQIGDIYNITRERVRQIEREAIRKLIELKEAKEFAGELKTLEEEAISYFEKNGGLIREDQLLDEYVAENHKLDFLHNNAYLFVLENLFGSVDKVEDHDAFYSIWKLNDLDLEKVADLLNKIEQHLQTEKKVYQTEDLLALAENKLSPELRSAIDEYVSKHGLELKNALGSYLAASAMIEKNILNEWGPAVWENIRPKKLGDKIHLIFFKENQPLHFRDIADRINEAKFAEKNICAATVHNELIANDKYVLIGRGIYALKDWGYVSGTVADIISSILTKATKPMSKDDIYNEVLKQRQVNKSTIYLTLINKDKFERVNDNLFALKK